MEKGASIRNRKPKDGAFRQQRLRAWQPHLRPTVVIPTLFIIGILFMIAGGLLYWNSGKTHELMIDYSTCQHYDHPIYLAPSMYDYRFDSSPKYDVSRTNSPLVDPTQPPVFHYINTTTFQTNNDDPTYHNPNNITIKQCTLDFTVPSTMKAPVFMYYRMTQFYQNHRQYAKNVDPGQLLGTPVDAGSADSNCQPITTNSDNTKIVFPCGLIANSMFNDSISDLTLISTSGDGQMQQQQQQRYVWYKNGLVWPTEYHKYGSTGYQINQIIPPPNWAVRFPQGQYTAQYPPPDLGKSMERLKVWMSVAALPDFRKIWGRNENQDLSAGRYRVTIDLNFDTLGYGGKKYLVLTTSSPLGGRNFYLGLTYLAVGGLCLLLATLFSFLHCIKPRNLNGSITL
ncbi:CDC50/LEM3 family [Absidia repens]|uniref:CDC50/LEM3 family n=1 Tax=Absidia repens TaxID=90262 RepID=A0A1X2IXN8_9FUNG|nr:CDC50/LEM3 family [Absidia repens]